MQKQPIRRLPPAIAILIGLPILVILAGLYAWGFAYGIYAFTHLPEWLPFWGPIIVLLILGIFARGGVFFIIAAILLFAVELSEKYNLPLAKLWH